MKKHLMLIDDEIEVINTSYTFINTFAEQLFALTDFHILIVDSIEKALFQLKLIKENVEYIILDPRLDDDPLDVTVEKTAKNVEAIIEYNSDAKIVLFTNMKNSITLLESEIVSKYDSVVAVESKMPGVLGEEPVDIIKKVIRHF